MPQKPHSLEYTFLLNDRSVFHYTCNPPKQEILDEYEIQCVGKQAGCDDDREVLIIPSRVFEEKGIPLIEDKNVLKINSENLLRIIERSL